MNIRKILSAMNRLLRPTVVKGKNNKISILSKRNSSFIIRIYGNNNIIQIGENCRLLNTLITLVGDNNRLILDDVAKFDGPIHVTLEGNATLKIGSNSGIRGVSFYAKDGDISIGKNCMFSYGIIIRNNDAHKVLDMDGNVTNKSGNITIEDHVWLCQNCAIIKPVTIEHDSIIAFGCIVTKNCPSHSILAGVPSKVVKTNINWRNK